MPKITTIAVQKTAFVSFFVKILQLALPGMVKIRLVVFHSQRFAAGNPIAIDAAIPAIANDPAPAYKK